MPLPQDTRAPHRQQRWIELENVGASTIPPFGVVEIVESYRPEQSGLVPGDGPTVVKVRRPTIDSLPHFYVNGPLPIPVGKRGQIGTNDFPCLASYETQDTPATGQSWGTVKDSYLIGRGRQGVAIVGDADTTFGLVRVNRAERLLRVTPVQDSLMPGETRECTVLRWNGSQWVATATTINVSDPMFRTCALPGEEFWCEAYGDEFQTVSEFGLRRRGYALQVIQPNGTGLVNFSSVTPPIVAGSCTGNRLGPVVDACYRVNNGSAIAVDDQLFVHYHTEFHRWFILPLGSNLIRFEMKKKLEFGAISEAIEIGTGPLFTPIGSVFPIKDPWREYGSWRYDPAVQTQARGYMGWCVIPNNPEYLNGVAVREIVWMEQIARSIEFILEGDMGANGFGIASATNYYLGKDPAQTDLFVGTRLLVYDSQRNYPRALEGAKGKARYNDRNHRYEIVECNQQAILLRADIDELCPGQSTATVSGHVPMTFPPYGQSPLQVSSAANIHNLANGGGARGTLAWDESTQRYILLQTEHQTLEVVNTGELTNSGCSLGFTLTRYTTSALTCGETDTVSDTIQMTEMDVVTDWYMIHTAPIPASGGNPAVDGACTRHVIKQSVCVLPGSGAASHAVSNLNAATIVQDVYQDGYCISITLNTIYVDCIEDQTEQDAICGDPCNPVQSTTTTTTQTSGGGSSSQNTPPTSPNAPGPTPGQFT